MILALSSFKIMAMILCLFILTWSTNCCIRCHTVPTDLDRSQSSLTSHTVAALRHPATRTWSRPQTIDQNHIRNRRSEKIAKHPSDSNQPDHRAGKMDPSAEKPRGHVFCSCRNAHRANDSAGATHLDPVPVVLHCEANWPSHHLSPSFFAALAL